MSGVLLRFLPGDPHGFLDGGDAGDDKFPGALAQGAPSPLRRRKGDGGDRFFSSLGGDQTADAIIHADQFVEARPSDIARLIASRAAVRTPDRLTDRKSRQFRGCDIRRLRASALFA